MKKVVSKIVMGILEFRIRILKDSNPKSQFISNNWNRSENTLALVQVFHHSQSFSLYVTFKTAFQALFLSSCILTNILDWPDLL